MEHTLQDFVAGRNECISEKAKPVWDQQGAMQCSSDKEQLCSKLCRPAGRNKPLWVWSPWLAAWHNCMNGDIARGQVCVWVCASVCVCVCVWVSVFVCVSDSTREWMEWKSANYSLWLHCRWFVAVNKWLCLWKNWHYHGMMSSLLCICTHCIPFVSESAVSLSAN